MARACDKWTEVADAIIRDRCAVTFRIHLGQDPILNGDHRPVISLNSPGDKPSLRRIHAELKKLNSYFSQHRIADCVSPTAITVHTASIPPKVNLFGISATHIALHSHLPTYFRNSADRLVRPNRQPGQINSSPHP